MFEKIRENVKLDNIIIISLIPAFLYVFGVVKHNSFLIFFGLNRSKMEKSFHILMYDGFLYIFTYPVIIMIIIFAFRYFKFLFFDDLISFICKSRLIVRASIKYIGKETLRKIKSEKTKILPTIRLLIYIVLIIVIINLLVKHERQGEINAKKLYDEINKPDKDTLLPYIEIRIDGKKMKLVFLECGSKNCAAIDRESKKIYYFSSNKEFSYYLEK